MKRMVLLALSGFILWGCSNTPDNTALKQEVTMHDENPEGIELNNGEKWLVNDEMKPFIEKGEVFVNVFIQNKQTDYKELARQIKDQNSQLIKSCTMDGKSHDELHKWLHPHLEITDALEKEADAETASKIVLQLQHSYREYHRYFK